MCPEPCFLTAAPAPLPASIPPTAAAPTSIRRALDDYLRRRQADRFSNAPRVARVVAFLELCIDNHGHRNLGADERASYESGYASGRQYADLFAPRRLLDELDFFTKRFLKEDVVTSEAIENAAEDVVADLKRFLVDEGHVSRADVERADAAARRRASLRTRTRKAARLVGKSAGPLPADVDERLLCDDYLIRRVEPGRLYLLVFRRRGPEEIGPLDVDPEATSLLEPGWCLCASLARVGGRWRLHEVHEVYARLGVSR